MHFFIFHLLGFNLAKNKLKSNIIIFINYYFLDIQKFKTIPASSRAIETNYSKTTDFLGPFFTKLQKYSTVPIKI